MKKIGVIGAPLCDGEREVGVEKAPQALRNAGLINALTEGGLAEVRDFGDIPLLTPTPDILTGKLRNLHHIVDSCRKVMFEVEHALRDGYFPLVLGGDCSLFPGALAAFGSVKGSVGAIYLDGHPDFHTPETTVSGYFSGMCLAAAVGKGPDALVHVGPQFPIIQERNVLLLAARERNIEPRELGNLQRSNVKRVTLDRLRADGFEQSLSKIAGSLPPHLYLHFDVDVMDPKEMPALAGITWGVHSEGGLTFSEVSSLNKLLSKLPIECMDITLYNPNLDKSAIYARKLIESLRSFFS